jgi:hypothetical protein
MIAFTCPRCRQLLSSDDRAQGKIARCARCGTQMAVPAPPPPAASPEPRPAPLGIDADVQPPPDPYTVPSVPDWIVKDTSTYAVAPLEPEPARTPPVPAGAAVPSSFALTQPDTPGEEQARRQQMRLLLYAVGGVGVVVCGIVLIAVFASGSRTAPPKTSSGGGGFAFRFTGRAPVKTSREEEEEPGNSGRTNRRPLRVDDDDPPTSPQSSRGGESNPKGGSGQALTPADKLSGGGRIESRSPEKSPSGVSPPPEEKQPVEPPPGGSRPPLEDEKVLSEARRWLKQLDGTFPSEDRIKALEALGKLGPPVKDVAGRTVAQCMFDRNPTVGLKAADAMERIDPAVGKDCRTIVSTDKEHILESIKALGQLGKDAKSAIPILVHVVRRLLETGQVGLHLAKPNEVAAAAIQALVTIAPGEKGLTAHFVNWLNAPDETVRLVIVIGLPRLEQGNKEDKQLAVTGLKRQLADNSVKVRGAAADGLGDFGPDAKGALEALEKARGDRDRGVRDSAKRALDKIRGEQ